MYAQHSFSNTASNFSCSLFYFEIKMIIEKTDKLQVIKAKDVLSVSPNSSVTRNRTDKLNRNHRFFGSVWFEANNPTKDYNFERKY